MLSYVYDCLSYETYCFCTFEELCLNLGNNVKFLGIGIDRKQNGSVMYSPKSWLSLKSTTLDALHNNAFISVLWLFSVDGLKFYTGKL